MLWKLIPSPDVYAVDSMLPRRGEPTGDAALKALLDRVWGSVRRYRRRFVTAAGRAPRPRRGRRSR
jgi:hypothetical protein